MISEGFFVNEFISDKRIFSIIYSEKGSFKYSFFDIKFVESGQIIYGLPSLHLIISETQTGLCFFAYLDLKSSTFTVLPENSVEKRLPFIQSWIRGKSDFFSAGVSEKIKDTEKCIEEIEFFSDLNIYILGYGADTDLLFQKLKERFSKIPAIFERQQTINRFHEARILNFIAGKSIEIQGNAENYIVPSVGIEGFELWLGTNSAFFAKNISSSDSPEEKEGEKFLFGTLFSRIVNKIAVKYRIAEYSVSKIEKALLLGGIKYSEIEELFSLLTRVNSSAPELINSKLSELKKRVGKKILHAKKTFGLLSSSIHEKDFIDFFVQIFLEGDENIKERGKNFFETNLREISEEIIRSIDEIDLILDSLLYLGGEPVES